MSVAGIQSTFASDQVSSIAATNALKYSRTQQLSSSNLDVPSDEATLQGGTSSTSGSSQGLTAVQKAYEFLQQAGTTAVPQPVGPDRFSGGPVRSKGVTADPIQTHEPMPPVLGPRTNLPNPIKAHDPLLPGPGSTTNLPIPTQFHDPLTPPTLGTTTSLLA